MMIQGHLTSISLHFESVIHCTVPDQIVIGPQNEHCTIPPKISQRGLADVGSRKQNQ